MSAADARTLVTSLLKEAGVSRPKGGWAAQPYGITISGSIVTRTFDEMVNEARKTGGVSSVQHLLDTRHPIFAGDAPSMAVSGASMTIGATFAGYEEHFKGPARHCHVEGELVDDILYFRRQSVLASSQPDFLLTSRYYRSYLFSTITLVDAFVNRFILLGRHQNISTPAFEALCESRNAAQRLQLWATVFGARNGNTLKQGPPWDHFQKLREERNRHIHATKPFFGYRIAKLPHGLNYCREGIGGLLTRLSRMAGYGRHSLFERLRTAPAVRYVGPK